MEYRILGEADPTMLKRIRAVTADDRVPAESNWNKGKPAAVAVIDTGINCTHPDLNVVDNITIFHSQDGCYDGRGHGTHIAGLIGAKNNGQGMVGSAPGIPLLSFRALGGDGKVGSASNITGAVNLVLDYRPKQPHHEPVVVNLSLEFALPGADNITQYHGAADQAGSNGTRRAAIAAEMQAWCEAFQKLQDAGITPVAAAGNFGRAFANGPDSVVQMLPAACDGVLAVTAVRVASAIPNREVDEAAIFNTNPELYRASGYAWSTSDEAVLARTIAAPGFQSYSTMVPGSAIYFNNPKNLDACQPGPATESSPWCSLSGTSQAAATVSGLVARCYAIGACSKNMTQAERLAAIVGRSKEYNLEHPEFGFRNDPASQAGGQSDGDKRPYYGWLIDGGMFIS